MATTAPFIGQAYEFAALFTNPQFHDPAKSGKYLASGMKPLEEFANDILDDLQYWACEGSRVFYRTTKYWYVIEIRDGVAWLTRYTNGSWARMDTWANPHSITCIGRELLSKHPEKRRPVCGSDLD